MADNSTQTGGDTIATDDVATLNGGASSGVKVQRVKVAFGDDGDARDASASFPLPVRQTINGTRTLVSINYNATAPPTTDTLLTTLVTNKGSTNTTGVTSVAVTSGKILRLTHVIVGTRATVATLPYGLVTLRVNHSGAAVIGSPAFFQVSVSGTAAVIGNTGTTAASIEDGMELSGTMQLGISYSGNLATNVVALSVLGYEY